MVYTIYMFSDALRRKKGLEANLADSLYLKHFPYQRHARCPSQKTIVAVSLS